ncbi:MULTISPECIES: amino acid ABC transporter permease [unclassified Achromobacter]|uniref:amino acid ABC transporter permease n=1 Tax=unclassified Achromobacter TaxID=2626865 RepID=UPI000B51A5E6|nr:MULTISPECIES: amino acid ABC transporter permease [unclassified Achromobacter]OWT73650.1 amino acid ABC transporter permease [Achromobacter sp. HZ34]OWT79434.1 amino acid ABC transporter permease [Achromobacter sp. HZ28]
MTASPLDRMFDAPGPRGRRNIRLASLAAVPLLAGAVWLVLHRFAQAGGLEWKKWQIFESAGVLKLLASALYATVSAAAAAGVLALVLGTALALLRLSRRRWVRGGAAAYVEVTRSLPTLLVLYFTILILPYYGIRLAVYWQLVLALTITNAAMIAEVLRASLLSIPKGQMEASLSLGLTRPRACWYIVLPQAFRAAMPALVSQIIYLLKGTVLGYVISYEELLYSAKMIGEYTNFILQSVLVVTAIYLVLNLAMSGVSSWVERRLALRGAAFSKGET